MAVKGKGKGLKKALKKGVSLLKKKAKKAATGYVKDTIKDASKSKDSKHVKTARKKSKVPSPDIMVSKNIQLGGAKKKKREKKIAKWEKDRKARAAVGSRQDAFLALDKKIKSQNKK